MSRLWNRLFGRRKRAAPIRHEAEAGFSLVEVTLVIVILGILGAGFSQFFLESARSYSWISDQAAMSPASRLAMNRALRELSMVRNSTSLYTITDQEVAFHNVDSDSLVLAWDGTAGSEMTLSKNGTTYTLAADVDSLGLTYFDSNGAITTTASDVHRIQLRLRLARGSHNVTFGSSVYVRNS